MRRHSLWLAQRIWFLRPSVCRKRIGLLGPYSFGNLGNAALQQSLIQHLSKRFPGSQFYGCCIDPDETPKTRQVSPFPLDRSVPWLQELAKIAPSLSQPGHTRQRPNKVRKWIKGTSIGSALWSVAGRIRSVVGKVREEWIFCRDGYRFAREFHFLVVGLGGVFDEAWGGKWRDLYSIFRWTVLARLARTPVLCLSVGVEEVHTTLGKFFCKTALSLAKYRSFRDEESKKKVEEMGVRGENRIFPDLAFGLDLQKNLLSTAKQEKSKAIGVSPIAYYDPRFWPVQDVSAYQTYLKRLASFVSWLLCSGYDVVLFPTQIRMDRTAIEELRASVLEDVPVSLHDRLTDSKLRTVDECLALLSQLAMVVTSRLHGVILSFLAGTPVLAISPANKIDSLMEDMELTEYVLGIREIELPWLVDRFQKLDGNRDTMKNRLQQKVAEYRLAVEAQFDIVFSSEGFLDATERRLHKRN